MTRPTELPVARLKLMWSTGDRFQIELKSPFAQTPTIDRPGYANLSTLYDMARESLEECFRHGAFGLHQQPRIAAEVLNEIRGLGRTILTALVGPPGETSEFQFRKFFQRVSVSAGGAVPAIAVDSPVDLPFELLPALWDADYFTGNSVAGIWEQSMSRFLGLRFVIHRSGQGSRSSPTDLVLHTIHDRVPLALYWHETLIGAEAERTRLQALHHVDLRDTQPTLNLASDRLPTRRLAQLLVRDRTDREEIVHVAAHCNAPHGGPVDHHAIIMAAKRTRWRAKEVRVSVNDLYNAVEAGNGRCEPPSGPLAFVNACQAANITFTSPTSIPDTFLDAHYRAVVSPLVSVHVDSAQRMALRFYEALGRGHTVGGALRAARSRLLRDHGNPLGLTYCCRGESRLRMAR